MTVKWAEAEYSIDLGRYQILRKNSIRGDNLNWKSNKWNT